MMREYSFVMTRDTTYPAGREKSLRRMRSLLENFPAALPDRALCYFHGLIRGWVISEVIGHLDADEVKELLPERPEDVISAIPYGGDVVAPEVDALSDDEILPERWFELWMGIKNTLYLFRRDGDEMPERSVLAWLGFLRGELEGNAISQAEYDKLCALLPPVNDDLTPLVGATQ
ncbi:MAG: hypothetical protein NVSMB64_19200 [Candidatus Velthaea sp.]